MPMLSSVPTHANRAGWRHWVHGQTRKCRRLGNLITASIVRRTPERDSRFKTSTTRNDTIKPTSWSPYRQNIKSDGFISPSQLFFYGLIDESGLLFLFTEYSSWKHANKRGRGRDRFPIYSCLCAVALSEAKIGSSPPPRRSWCNFTVRWFAHFMTEWIRQPAQQTNKREKWNQWWK